MDKEYTAMPPRRSAESKTYPCFSFENACELIEKECGNVYITERHGDSANKVIILPEAFQELKTMISYGRRSPMNIKEQKFIGVGHILGDKSGHPIDVVSHFIEIHTMNRTAVGASNLGPNGEYNPGLDFLAYYREEFFENEAKYNTDAYGYTVDPFIKICGNSEFILEGHTHPDLGTFYSSTDRISGSARAACGPICIFVCDPIRKEMLGSIGKKFAKAEVIVYDRKTYDWEDPKELGPPVDEIARLTSYCLRLCNYKGKIKIGTRFNGRTVIRIKLAELKEKLIQS